MTFKIRSESSGREFDAQEKETVLAAALRQGVMLPYSCRNGACGSCKGKLLSGKVDYGTYESRAMNEAEKEKGYALFCQARPLSDLVIEVKEVAAARDIPIRIMPARVVKMEKLADDVMRLSLKLAEGQRLQYLAGQYIDILLSGNLRRSFSLSTSPLSDELLQLHIRHVPGGHYTDHVFQKMKEKDLIRFQGPFGMFFLREDSERPAILIAGGTGFAPIKSILEYAFAQGIKRPLHLYWGARAKRDLYLADLAQQWAKEHKNFKFTPVLSEPQPEDHWSGRQGWVHEAVAGDHPDLSQHEVYASGPPPMIDAIKAMTKKLRLPEDRLYYDSFEFAHAPAP
ncbi:MAG: CDP-6-deoxy-delta-3,4-glucoseen reductase [Gammaproteobacteria bacterium]|nr:CDP-6-deoxy-delta-3,4-glucoseen reductase [Gammaproteobacteria bacterium]